MKPFKRRSGYSLIEMCIVLAIITTVVASGMTIFSNSLQQRQFKDTQKKLDVIQQALLNFRTAYNRIPCPADATMAVGATSSNYFGIEAATPGTCTGSTPAANFSNGNNVEGMVPTKTLRLSDDYAFDGYGRRIMYAVDARFTANNAFITINASDTITRMTVNDSSGNPKTTTAAYVLLSMGPNGHGAYPRGTGTANLNIASSRINVGSVNTDELNNCDCSSSAVATGLDGVFVQKTATQDSSTPNHTDDFDDVVAFATRGSW